MIAGRTKFTQLDKNNRRQWMEITSGLDFDYAFDVYKKVKPQSHSIKVVKVTTDHLVSESAKKLDSAELVNLDTEQKELNKLITEVLTATDTFISSDLRTIQNNVVSTEKQFKKEMNNLLNLKSRKKRILSPVEKPLTVEEIRGELQLIKETLSGGRRSIDNLTLEISELNQLKDKLLRTDGYTLENVSEKLGLLVEQLRGNRRKVSDEVLFDLIKDWSGDDWLSAHEYTGLQHQLHELFDTVPENVIELPHSKEHQQSLLKSENEYRIRINKGHGVVNKVELKLKHFLECENTKCPKCDNQFKVGMENLTEEGLKTKLNEAEILLESLIKEHKEIEVKISEYSQTQTLITAIKELVVALDNPFLSYYKNIDFTCINKGTVLGYVDTIIGNKEVIEQTLEMIKEKNQLDVIYKELESQSNLIDLNQLSSKHKTLLDKLESQRQENTRYENMGRNLKGYGEYLKRLDEQQSLVLSLGMKLKQVNEGRVKALEELIKKDIVAESQKRVAVLTKTLSEQKSLEATLEAMQRQIDSSKAKLSQLTAIEKALNPSVGVIAKQMGGYVSAFANQLSAVIGRLWGYELEILPPSIDGAKGMDYKFPFVIEGNYKNPIPDISEGSKATVAGFNLGIMLATRIALGMEQMPLFLDEVSDGFDTTHNERLAEFIKELLNECGCSNMFFVHHDAEIRNALGQHDMIVFDASQVVINGEYNQNVSIEYLA